ncbi:MAG TPA: hypothetical protein VD999_07820 [Vitreimonas sp.]|nr:hypothetical protein [Vitreimonas sp.]
MKEKTHVYEPLRKNLPHIHWQRIENVAGTGVADINGCFRGIEFWIESKISKGSHIEIRPDQIAWLTKRYEKGGRVFVVYRQEDTIGVLIPDGRGSFRNIFQTGKPFKYKELENIFLYHPMK